MLSSNSFKVFAALTLVIILSGCATSSPSDSDKAEQTASDVAPKPSAETIEAIKNAGALEQANFWNQQYNLHPTDLDISLAYINSLAAINSYERAAEVAKFTSVSFPEKPEVFMLLGKMLNKNNKALDAARAYGKVVELSPYDAAPLAALGGIFDSREDHDTAQIAYRRALALDPDRPATLSNLGMSLTLVGKLEEAEEALEKAVALPGATPPVRQNYALVLGLLGKFDKAREIAAIDAPDGVAERNTAFLKALIGENPRLQAIAQAVADGPAKTTPVKPFAKATAPLAAPSQTVASAALSETFATDGDKTLPFTKLEVATAPVVTQTAPSIPLRGRQRNSASGGQ